MEKELPIVKPTKREEEIVFPEEFSLIIQDILKRYNLFKIHEEGVKKMMEAKTSEERKSIAEILPGYKISQFVRDYGEGRISLGKIPLLLKAELRLDEGTAKKIAKDMYREMLILVKPRQRKTLPPENINEPKPPVRKTLKEETLEPEQKKPLSRPIESDDNASPKKPDSYREEI